MLRRLKGGAKTFGQEGSRISWRHRGGRERRRPGGKSSTIRNWFAKAELSCAITQSEDFPFDPGLLLISQPQREGTGMPTTLSLVLNYEKSQPTSCREQNYVCSSLFLQPLTYIHVVCFLTHFWPFIAYRLNE